MEINVDKVIKELSDRRIILMKDLCENQHNIDETLQRVNELRHLTGLINELQRLKKEKK